MCIRDREWSRLSSRKDNSVLVREYDGTVRAVLSDRYNVFNTASVLNNVRKAVSNPHLKNRYEMNQIFMDTDKLHIRLDVYKRQGMERGKHAWT